MATLSPSNIEGVQCISDTEEWRDVPGYEHIYEVSNLGNIRTVFGKVTKSARFPHRVWKQRILKQKKNKNKKGRIDCRVSLWKDGKEKTFLVARIVAMAFCDGYSDGLTVNHIDGNTLNNTASNLEWCSREENIRKGFETGLFSTPIPVAVKDKSGIEHEFSSLSSASKYYGMSHGYIAKMIRMNNGLLHNGCQARFIQ